MRNLQGCEDIQKTDVIEWLATDDPAYCNTDLDDNEIILTVTGNTAYEPEDTENSDNDTEEAFLTVTHSEGKEALEMALRYIEQQKESTPGDDVLIKKWRDYAASKRRSCRSQWPCGLRRGSWPVGCRDRGFESRLRHGCCPRLSVLCCPV
jgi:hypothetical protein